MGEMQRIGKIQSARHFAYVGNLPIFPILLILPILPEYGPTRPTSSASNEQETSLKAQVPPVGPSVPLADVLRRFLLGKRGLRGSTRTAWRVHYRRRRTNLMCRDCTFERSGYVCGEPNGAIPRNCW